MSLPKPLDWISCSSPNLGAGRTPIGGLHETGKTMDSCRLGCLAGLLGGLHSTFLVGGSKTTLKQLAFIGPVIDPRRFGQ
jgi:hypothetical protein